MQKQHFIDLMNLTEYEDPKPQKKRKPKAKQAQMPSTHPARLGHFSFFCTCCQDHYDIESLAVHKVKNAFDDPSDTYCVACEWLLEHTPIISAQAQTPARE